MWSVRASPGARLWAAARVAPLVRYAAMSTSAMRLAVHEMTMPAMSPTMDKGNLGNWKLKEGDSFTAGTVMLEVVCFVADARKPTRP